MKRLLHAGSVLVLIVSFIVANGTIHAAHQGRAARETTTLHLCLSFPFGAAPYADTANGIRRGAQLANGQWKGRLKSVGITLTPPVAYDNTAPGGNDLSPQKEVQNARTCIADSHAIAYLGTMSSVATLASLPYLNKAGMLMISPADTSPDITNPGPKLRGANEPATFHHRLKYVTYYRTVTTDSIQGAAGAAFMHKTLLASGYFLVDDKQGYGKLLAARFDGYAKNHLHMTQAGSLAEIPSNGSAGTIAENSDAVSQAVLSTHAPAVYYGGSPAVGSVLLRRLRARGFNGPFLGAEVLANPTFISDTGNATVATYATAVGPDPLKTAASFRTAYRKAFPKSFPKPGFGPYDAAAYDAAGIALMAIYQAALAGTLTGSITAMRESLLPIVANVHYSGAMGSTSFDKNGDTTNKIISIYAVSGASWVFKGYAPKVSIAPVP